MKRFVAYIILGLTFLPVQRILGQADICMTTHWYNRSGYNPAFIARTDYAYLFANYRNQWVGVDGAPQVINVQLSEYFNSLKSAVGFSLIDDKIGVTQVINPMLSYAFRITGEKYWSLAMGLSCGIFKRSIDGTRFEADADGTTTDNSINYTVQNTQEPDANAGVEFQNSTFIVGLSSTHLFSIGKPTDSFLNSNHRYGYVIYKNNKLEAFYYKIGLLVINRLNLTVLEGNAFIRFKHSTGLMNGPREIFDLGVSVRSSRQMTFLIGMLLTPDLRLGYSYDHSFISGYNRNSTHEIFLEYRIPNKLASTKPHCGKEIHWYH
jgi:type IX secretion system PorP/SprF family membrane protein